MEGFPTTFEKKILKETVEGIVCGKKELLLE